MKNTTEFEVIQNSDKLYKKDIEWEPAKEPQEINEFEKNMLVLTKNVNELLDEETNTTIKELSEEEAEIIKRRDYIAKVKVISLDIMNKYPLENPSNFTQREKKKLMDIMENTIKTLSEEEITKQFNEVCIDKLFTEKADYSNFPTYNI
jgi:hypothetical protein